MAPNCPFLSIDFLMVRLNRIFGTKEYSKVWCNLDLCGLLTFEVGECTLFLSFYFISVSPKFCD